jgi:hypothetical protein
MPLNGVSITQQFPAKKPFSSSQSVLATGYIGWTTNCLEFESELGKDFSLLHVIRTGREAQPASDSMGTVSEVVEA